MLPDGSIHPGEMTSFNHYAFGAVADFLHRRVAGLAPAEPGYRRLVFAPLPSRELSWARAEHETPYGTASIAWRLDGDMVTVDVLVPASSQAQVQLPDGSAPRSVDAGRHRFTCRLPQEAVTGRPVEFVPA